MGPGDAAMGGRTHVGYHKNRTDPKPGPASRAGTSDVPAQDSAALPTWFPSFQVRGQVLAATKALYEASTNYLFSDISGPF